MSKKLPRCLLALSVAVTMVFTACGSPGTQNKNNKSNNGINGKTNSDALTWGTCNSYAKHTPFLELLHETYPEIELEFISYAGGNSTGYSWAQMRADDIPDIFITTQILDQDLAKERLVDLSGYDFINDFSTAILDQVSIDGGIYLLPTSNAMYGIYYNKTLMEEHGWEVPADFNALKTLCEEIEEAGLIPGMVATKLTGGTFSCVFNLAKTDWLTTPEGLNWEQDFLSGNAAAEGAWDDTMRYVQQYIDIGMFHTDPEDRDAVNLLLDDLKYRKCVFFTGVQLVNITRFEDTGDELGMMPYISEDGSKNIYMYSPNYYFGISSRLTEPGNEKKLENAVRILSLLYSPEGQATLISEQTPCVMSVLDSAVVPEDSLIYDAQQAMRDGRAFPMTYANWENVLSDMGQAYKEWFRGENDMDGAKCITRMDKLQQSYLDSAEDINFCESTADFTPEETGALVGKAMGTAVGADAAMIPLGGFHDGVELRAGVNGKLYAGYINVEVANTIVPGYDGEYALMTMTGEQAKELAAAGFDMEGNSNPFPYVLVTKGGEALEDNTTYQVVFLMNGYTEEVGQTYNAQVEKGSLRTFLREWLTEQKTVSPDGNPWN